MAGELAVPAAIRRPRQGRGVQGFTGCQRFEASLAEPLLLTVDGDAVLRGKVIEGSEGGSLMILLLSLGWGRSGSSSRRSGDLADYTAAGLTQHQ
jgi:hypothetical protein